MVTSEAHLGWQHSLLSQTLGTKGRLLEGRHKVSLSGSQQEAPILRIGRGGNGMSYRVDGIFNLPDGDFTATASFAARTPELLPL